MRLISILSFICAALFMTSCGPGRVEKDARLQNACLSIVRSLYEQNDTLDVQESFFADATSPDKTRLRVVTLRAHYVHGRGIIEDKTYTCSFEESLIDMSYQPRFYNVDRAGLKVGNFDGTIEGTLEDFASLSQITENAFITAAP